MRIKVADGPPPTAAPVPPPPVPEVPRVVVPVDASNESTIIAAAYLHPSAREVLIARLVQDHFQAKQHRDLWVIFQAAKREGLDLDAALVEALGGAQLREYVEELASLKPELPKNLDFHVHALLGDHARVTCVRGPLSAFHEALRDPKTDVATLHAVARSISQCFEGHNERRYLHDPEDLVHRMMASVDQRVGGLSCFGYGVETLDYHAETSDLIHGQRRRRLVPGPAPGETTIVTANPGIGKTTLGQTFSIGIAFPKWESGDFETPGRTVLYGSWEPRDVVTLEGLAALSLGWSRSEQAQGIGRVATREGRIQLEERAHVISRRIRIMSNPFRRVAGLKATNERNLDLVQGYIADSGCRVFCADLWQRCLVDSSPAAEMEALFRQQAMAGELDVHNLLLQQQRSKETERIGSDPRPSRDNIKGSGAWTEIGDTILGAHRPGIYKPGMIDNVFEIDVMKQRRGVWPLRVSFRFDRDTGRIYDGRSVDVTRPGDLNEIDQAAGGLSAHLRRGR